MFNSGKKNSRNFIVSLTLAGIVVLSLGCGKWGGENEPAARSNAPAAPANVAATAGNGAVTITWDASPSATSYNVYYSTQTGASKSSNRIAGATSPAVVSNLSNGIQYHFVVTAVSSGGESVESAEVFATPSSAIQAPAAPLSVAATPGNGQVTVSWSLSAGATSYNIYYGTTSGNLRATGSRIAGATSPWVITGLVNGTVYNFVVTAVNSNLESVDSTQVSATPALGL